MGTALKFLRDLLEKFGLELDKRTATSLLILLVLLILLPIGLFLVRNQLTFLPKAAGELIQLGEGGCIKLDKNKKKVVDCPTVPLKLINPFYNIKASIAPSSQNSASPVASANPSSSPTSNPTLGPSSNPSPSVTAQNCATSVTTGAELLSAVNCYKNAGTGGRITLPAGTLEVNEKISVPSNLTIAGAGINATTIRMSAAFEKKTSPSSDGDDALMANDSSHGQQNIVLRDFKLQGDGQRSGNSCCFGLKLQNVSNSFIVNVGVDSFGLDGIYLGSRPNKPGANRNRLTGCSITNNGRNGITIADGVENVIDHCQISGNSTNELVAGIDIEPDNGSEASDNHIFENSITNNRNNGISITQNPHDPGGLVLNNSVCNNSFGGNSGTDFDDQGFSTKTSGCSDLGLNPPTALINTFTAFIDEAGDKLKSLITPKIALAAPGYSGVETNGCGEIISTPSQGAIQGNLTYKAPVRVNNQWQTQKTDGTVITQQQIQQRVQADTRSRNAQFFADTYINCDVFITYSEGGDCDIDSPPKGREGINGGKLSPGESVTFTVRADSTPQSPGCRIQMQTQVSTDSDDDFTPVVSASVRPSASPVLLAAISPTPLPPTPPANALRYRLAESQAGLTSAPWREFVLIQEKEKSIFAWAVGTVFAQDSDDNFTGTSGDDSDDDFTPGSGTPISSGNPTFSIGKQFITMNYQLSDTQPGAKQIWVQYMHPDGTTKVDHVTFNLVDKVPQITGLACNLDISKQSLKVTVDGNYFGNDIGKVTAVSGSSQIEILGWNNTKIQASLKSPNIPINQGQRFQFKVARPDGFESETVTCLVDKSLISLGARLFCREPGKFDATDVLVTLLYNNENKISKVEEKVSINADGELTGLKTQLQAGKGYAISVKAPGSLRRGTSFVAYEGTTQITKPDGTPFILPVGDIAPVILADGQINTLDRAELIRQWRILSTSNSTKQTGDFNRDGRVNSIDWACMQYDFGASDDLLPVEVPGSTSNTITIPKSNSGTITIPGSPAPR